MYMMNWAATREAPAPPRAHGDTTRGWSSRFLISQCWFWRESADFCGTDVKRCWVLHFCWWLNKYLEKRKNENRRDVAILQKSFCDILLCSMLMRDRMCPLKYIHWPCCWFHYLHPILLAAPHESCLHNSKKAQQISADAKQMMFL